MTVKTAPHDWVRNGRRFWLCRHCLAPKSEHPRKQWTTSRALGDNTYIGKRPWRRGQVN